MTVEQMILLAYQMASKDRLGLLRPARQEYRLAPVLELCAAVVSRGAFLLIG